MKEIEFPVMASTVTSTPFVSDDVIHISLNPIDPKALVSNLEGIVGVYVNVAERSLVPVPVAHVVNPVRVEKSIGNECIPSKMSYN